MSHVIKRKGVGTQQVKDLDVLQLAAARCGCTLVRGQKSYHEYYGSKPCEHAITIPNCDYSVGLTANPDGSYSLECDYFRQQVGAAIGEDATKLLGYYELEQYKKTARAQGDSCREIIVPGSDTITLEITPGMRID